MEADDLLWLKEQLKEEEGRKTLEEDAGVDGGCTKFD